MEILHFTGAIKLPSKNTFSYKFNSSWTNEKKNQQIIGPKNSLISLHHLQLLTGFMKRF